MSINSKYREESKLVLFERTVEKHKMLCEELNIFCDYERILTAGRGNFGGEEVDQARSHFLGRYLNSAARTQVVVDFVDDDLEKVAEDIISYFLDGTFYIIDIAAGHGAGLISIINNICRLRESGDFPKERLNVVIHAIDFSSESLSFYQRIIEFLHDEYISLGINVSLECHKVDISNDVLLSNVVSGIKESIGANPRFFLICSAISGVGRNEFEKKFIESYKKLTKIFSAKNSSFVWIEPAVKGDWVSTAVDSIQEELNKDYGSEDTPDKIKLEFYWQDPHTMANLKANSEVHRISLSHE